MKKSSWKEILSKESSKPYVVDLKEFVRKERERGDVFPPDNEVFQAFQLTPFDDVKVVILGQDPYHGHNQAHGLCFSVKKGVVSPPSLKNIYKELKEDLGILPPSHGCLVDWARQGVFLLNATLTVRRGEPMSHHGRGWEQFTDRVIETLCLREDPIVFVLWGRSAGEKGDNILAKHKHPHLVLKASHPSPLSAYTGFLGCKHFSKANTFLQNVGKIPIDWRIH